MNAFHLPVTASLCALLLGGSMQGAVNPALMSVLSSLREQDGLSGQFLDFARIGKDFSQAQKAVMGERAILKTKRHKAIPASNQEQAPLPSRQRTTSLHIGPLPLPEVLAGYKEFVPDAPERILAMAEKEQAARIEREREVAAAVERDAISAREAQKRAGRNSVLL